MNKSLKAQLGSCLVILLVGVVGGYETQNPEARTSSHRATEGPNSGTTGTGTLNPEPRTPSHRPTELPSYQASDAQQRPSRIISLIPAVTEMLFAMGAGPQVVAVSSFDEYPPEVKNLQRVGALLDPDVERILALRPDLVVIYGSQVDLQRQLERAKIPLYVYRHAGLAHVTVTIRELGERVGRAAESADVIRRIDERLAEIRRRVRGMPRPKTLIVFGRETGALRGIYASGGFGFINDMLDAAGGENLFADITRESVQATTETILSRKPDVIIELRGDKYDSAQIARETAVWRKLTALPAVRSDRIHFIVDPRTVVPGPRVAEGAELIARAVHPEAFR